jgi:hypothetical protein
MSGMFETPYYDPQLTQADIRGIMAVTKSGWSAHQIISVRIIAGDQVEVRTGVVLGALSGHGDTIVLERSGSGWRKLSSSIWMS